MPLCCYDESCDRRGRRPPQLTHNAVCVMMMLIPTGRRASKGRPRRMQASDKAPLHSVICSAASLAPWQPQSTVAARVPHRGTSPLAAAAAHLSAPGQWPCSCPLCCHGEPAWAMKDNMRSGRQSVSMKTRSGPWTHTCATLLSCSISSSAPAPLSM